MSELFSEFENELVDVAVPPSDVEIVRAGEAGKDEPAAVAWVNALAPEEVEELNKPMTEAATKLAAGMRGNGRGVPDDAKDELEKVELERYVDWAQAIFHHTTGFTPTVINYLLAPAKKGIDFENSPTIMEQFEDVEGRKEVDLGKHPKFAGFLLKLCRKEEFDLIVSTKVRSAAREYTRELQGKGSA